MLHVKLTMPNNMDLTDLGDLPIAQTRITGISYLATSTNGYQYANTSDVYVLLKYNHVYVRLLYTSYQGQPLDVFLTYQ